jgi:hypothetical protein
MPSCAGRAYLRTTLLELQSKGGTNRIWDLTGVGTSCKVCKISAGFCSALCGHTPSRGEVTAVRAHEGHQDGESGNGMCWRT